LIGFDRGSQRKRCLVLDTTALLAAIQLSMAPMDGNTVLLTTSSNVEEVKDFENRSKLEVALEIGRIVVKDPDPRYVEKVVEVAKRVGSLGKLSFTDLQLVALALELRDEGMEVVVLSDDYHVQNLLAHLGIEFRALRTPGIREKKVFRRRSSLG